MMRQYELVERVMRYNANADEGLLNKAYVYGMTKHGRQQRASGDPYFSHPLEVAAILTDMRLDDATIAVALLHDTIEDTDATRAEIDTLFGSEIGQLVEGLTKIQRLDLVSKEAAQAENLRKLLLAISDDVRVLIVKLADRLHNMRTLHYVPEEKRKRIAEETRDIYAPLAGRMGMREMREELEELAFAVINKNAFDAVNERLANLRESNQHHIDTVVDEVNNLFKKAELKADVNGREKRPFSIFTKMQRKSVGFEQLSDVYGFRVLVDDIADCYRALGIIHMRWASVPGRFKDFISTPKQNDYRSLHTTVIGPGSKRVELQIRTHEMHSIAEYGVAAHTLYKDISNGEGGGDGNLAGKVDHDSYAYIWLQNTVNLLAGVSEHDDETSLDFIENTKLELFQDQVFCFTPKGRLITLPRGANSIDFAYAVHTDIGDTCVGTKINGRIMPLVTTLSNGDEVDILRSPAQKPLAVWENFAVTGKARAAIRRSTRDQSRRQHASLGRQIIERQFEHIERPLSDELIIDALPRLGFSEVDELMAKIGSGEMPPSSVIEAIYPDLKETTPKTKNLPSPKGEGWFAMGSDAVKFKIPDFDKPIERGEAAPFPLKGVGADFKVKFAPNGGALPGDRIVGILEPGVGVTIYPIQSLTLSHFDDAPEVWLDVRWDVDPDAGELFPARIVVSVLNEPGTLAQIAQIIASLDSNIERLELVHGATDFTDIKIDLMVSDLTKLNRIIAEIKTTNVVSAVERIND
ncbi:MAG: bifunctional (p)ppGpp synthetase/guanosine-3',5'-bis(diphosphate) 3'-pyrophosphohydrolase [Hyphomicrobiales bacterium]